MTAPGTFLNMTTTVGSVAELWRFPVKSLQGTPVDALTFSSSGAEGDRTWGVVDPAAGRVLSAKRWPALLHATGGIDGDGTVTVTLPDGGTHVAGDPATDAALSAWLDHEVRLIEPPAGDGLFYDLPTDAWDDTSPLWQFPGPPGGPFVDLAAAHLLTTASLRAAAALHPDGVWDVRRFRPTVLVEADGDGFVEDDWVGATVSAGTAGFAPFMPTVRCAMTTREQPGLPRDVAIAKVLNQHHDLNLGVYCAVERPGTIRVGDDVQVGRA
jgi:uncharacterized protein YcbX